MQWFIEHLNRSRELYLPDNEMRLQSSRTNLDARYNPCGSPTDKDNSYLSLSYLKTLLKKMLSESLAVT